MKKKFEKNLAVLVTMHTLSCLNGDYSDQYPKEIAEKIENLVQDLIAYNAKGYPHADMLSSQLYEIVEYKNPH